MHVRYDLFQQRLFFFYVGRESVKRQMTFEAIEESKEEERKEVLDKVEDKEDELEVEGTEKVDDEKDDNERKASELASDRGRSTVSSLSQSEQVDEEENDDDDEEEDEEEEETEEEEMGEEDDQVGDTESEVELPPMGISIKSNKKTKRKVCPSRNYWNSFLI